MPRVRTALLAREASRELDTYLRQRALHFACAGNFAIAADYAIHLLNRKPKDVTALLIGEVAAARTNQPALRDKCISAQRRLCAAAQTNDAMKLISDTNTAERLSVLREESAAAAASDQSLLEEMSVRESEPLAATESAVRAMALRSSGGAPLVALLSPKGSADGRGLYANCRIPKGLPLMSDAPFASCALPNHCAQCLRPLSGASVAVPCEGCDGAELYCSTVCRDVALREYHACACAGTNPSFAAWTAQMREQVKHGEGADKRAALECLFVAKLCAMATARQTHPLAMTGIAALRGRAAYDAATALSEIGAMAVALAAALRQTHLYMEEVLSLFAIVQSNEFILTGGTALYYGFSMLNHSCDPNGAIVGTDTARQHLVALRDIREGEQVLINYNANLTARMSYEERRALCQQRHFECFCAKCVRRE